MSDREYIGKLQKALEELYQHEYSKLLNKWETHEIYEARGYIKAIAKFGQLIDENRER